MLGGSTAQLVRGLSIRVTLSFQEVDDLVRRMAYGIRHYLRRAHEGPHWGRFLNRFGFSSATLQPLRTTDPVRNLAAGIDAGRYMATLARRSCPGSTARDERDCLRFP